MKKTDSLRAAITAALPEFAAEPKRLIMWIDQGAARGRQTSSESFEMKFRLNVQLVEMTTDIAVLMLTILHWCRVHQPDLLGTKATAVTFNADILDNGAADVEAQIALTQSIAVATDEVGTRVLSYTPEPNPLFDDELGLGGVAPVPPLAAVLIAGEGQVAPPLPPELAP